MKSFRRMLYVVVLILLSPAVLAQSDAQKSFDKLKTLAGLWEGHVTTVPQQADIEGKLMQVSLRADPFDEGDCIAVRAISRNDLVVRTLRLPIAILVGLADRFLKRPGLVGESLHDPGTLPGAPFATGAVTTPLIATTIT